MLLPVSQLGRDYVISTLEAGSAMQPVQNGGNAFSVTASEDNTTVTLSMQFNNWTGAPVGILFANKTYYNGDVIVQTLNKYENLYVSYYCIKYYIQNHISITA